MIKAPAAERNKQPILDVLKSLIRCDSFGDVLEIASGTGQHVIHFAQHFKNMTFSPTDCDPSAIQAISTNLRHVNLPNIRSPVRVDVSLPVQQWPASVTDRSYDLMICTNMIHISPWICTQGLFAAASRLLAQHGRLLTYGPYAIRGVLEPESNVQFDRHLKSQNPDWGVRDTQDVSREAACHHFRMTGVYDMPANNKILVFERVPLQ